MGRHKKCGNIGDIGKCYVVEKLGIVLRSIQWAKSVIVGSAMKSRIIGFNEKVYEVENIGNGGKGSVVGKIGYNGKSYQVVQIGDSMNAGKIFAADALIRHEIQRRLNAVFHLFRYF